MRHGRLRPKLDEWFYQMWKDFLGPHMHEHEKEFCKALPEVIPQRAEEHWALLRERQASVVRLHTDFHGFVGRFSVEENEALVVRPLAYLSGYLISVEGDVLHLQPDDPVCR